MNTVVTANAASPVASRPQKSERWGLLLGLALVALVSIALYWRSTGIGFLLDDVFRPRILYAACHGQIQGLLSAMFSGGAAATCGLTAFRPGSEISFILDYLLWSGNAFGYHLTNILSFAANSVLVGLITLDLSRWFAVRSKTLVAVGAGLLFACYPLHVESTAWVIGRVDVLCTMFYLGALYCYMRHLERPSAWWLVGAYGSFLASLSCKEMAVTLPVVAAGLAFCRRMVAAGESPLGEAGPTAGSPPPLPTQVGWLSLAGFFLVLAAFAVVRTLALHTVVGGYGTFDKHTFRQVMRNIFDLPTWCKVVFPATDEFVRNWSAYIAGLRLAAYLTTAAVAVCAVITCAREKRLVGLFAFLLGWFFIALLPTFQILHIFPNLVGSRLFFLSSAPLCMLIAFACAAAPPSAPQQRAAVRRYIIVAICAVWAVILQINLEPWIEAGRRMATAAQLVQTQAAATARGDKVLFANLPADYKGAGLISRPEYLQFMLKPPLFAEDVSDRIETCERPIPGPNAFVFPNEFQRKVNQSKNAYIWNEQAAKFVRWTQPEGLATFNLNDQRNLADPDFNGTRWLFHKPVNPCALRAVEVTFAEPVHMLGPITFIWSTPAFEWWQCIAGPTIVGEHTITFVPSRLRTWTFAPSIGAIGLQGGKTGHLLSARSIDMATVEPLIEANRATVKVDGSRIPGCSSVRIFVARQGQSFSDLASPLYPDSTLVESSYELPDAGGEIELPPQVLGGSGIRAVCAQALDENHQPLGILSEVVAAHL